MTNEATKHWRVTVTYQTVVVADSHAQALKLERAQRERYPYTDPTGVSVRQVMPEQELVRVIGYMLGVADAWEAEGKTAEAEALRNAVAKARAGHGT